MMMGNANQKNNNYPMMKENHLINEMQNLKVNNNYMNNFNNLNIQQNCLNKNYVLNLMLDNINDLTLGKSL